MAYNESNYKNLQIRHLFYSGYVSLFSEIVLTLSLLSVLLASDLENTVLKVADASGQRPSELIGNAISKFIASALDFNHAADVATFVFWGIAGMLFYIMLFYVIRLGTDTRQTVGEGISLYSAEHSKGLMKWLSKINNTLIKICLGITGVCLMIFSVGFFYSYATYAVKTAIGDFSDINYAEVGIAFLVALLGTRVFVFGLCLMSARFRNFYVN